MSAGELPFIINPSMRISSPYLAVIWRELDPDILRNESCFGCAHRAVFKQGQCPALFADTDKGRLYIYHSKLTDFQGLTIQKWLREEIRGFIVKVASDCLPSRLHELEKEKGIYCRSVSVKKLRSNILGQCTVFKDITLSPKIVLFPGRMSDAVMLHEMAHLRYMHHKKSFWNFLSELLGEDSNSEKYRSDLAYLQKSEMIKFLLK